MDRILPPNHDENAKVDNEVPESCRVSGQGQGPDVNVVLRRELSGLRTLGSPVYGKYYYPS